MHEGHRMRMYEKLKKYPDSLEDHELIEIFLFNACPRKNTNPLAHDLIDSFGDIRGVFEADPEELKNLNGIGEQTAGYIKCVSYIFERLLRSKESPVLKKIYGRHF